MARQKKIEDSGESLDPSEPQESYEPAQRAGGEERHVGISADNQDDVALENLLLGLADSGAKIRINRIVEGKPHYMGSIPIAGVRELEEFVRKKFGGGDYQCGAFSREGKFIKGGRFPLSIDPSCKPETIPEQIGTGGSSVAESLKAISSLIPALKALLPAQPVAVEPREDKTLTVLVAMMNQQAQQTALMMQGMTQIMVAALGSKPQGSDVGVQYKSLVDSALQIADAKSPSGSNSIMETITMLKGVKELFSGVPVEPKEEEDMFSKVISLAGKALPMISAMRQPQQQQQPIQQMQPAPQMEVETTGYQQQQPQPVMTESHQQLTEEQKIAMGIIQKIAPFRLALLNAAQTNQSVDLYADLVEQNLSEVEYGILCRVLNEPEWLQVMFGEQLTDAQKYALWFDKLKTAILNPPDDSDKEPETTS